MNFDVFFDKLPLHLSKVYVGQCGDALRKPSNQRSNKASVLLAPTDHQLQNIRDIAKQLPLEVLSKIPFLAGRLEEFRKLMEGVPSFNPLPCGGTFECYFERSESGERLALWKSPKTFLAAGTSEELFSYAMLYCPAAAQAVVKASRLNFVKARRKKPPFEVEQLSEMLDDYRAVRRLSQGMNSVTKMSQLSAIDQSLTVNKFYFENHLLPGPIDHYGSGKETSFSSLALPVEDARYIDPALSRSQGNWCKGGYFQFPPRPGSSIISDIAVGDGNGLAEAPGFKAILEHMIAHVRSYDTVLVVKMSLVSKLDFPCVLLNKVQPHNLEVVVMYNEEGGSFQELAAPLRESVLEANDRRNECLITGRTGSHVKSNAFDERQFREIAKKRYKFCSVERERKYTPTGRLKLLSAQLEGGSFARRSKAFGLECEKEISLDGDWCLLPPEKLKTGFLSNNDDPLVGPVEYSVRSLLRTASHYGKRIKFVAEAKTTVGWYLH